MGRRRTARKSDLEQLKELQTRFEERRAELEVQLEEAMAKNRARNQRLIRRGYLPGSPFPWKVPDDLLDIYREQYPDLGVTTWAGRPESQ